MNTQTLLRPKFVGPWGKQWLFLGVLGGILVLPSAGFSQDNHPMPGGDFQGEELLARGPVHEAFLHPLEGAGQQAEVIDREPPPMIDEIPPDAQPEGNVEWIPGYWFWSPVDNDFIWVSGVWREPPPGQRWVPGYWEQANGGFRWIPGFWAAADLDSVTYLPPPPESLEQGPSSPAPSDEYFWVSGCWVYQHSDYRWRAGYWARHQPGWIWTPNYYTWTPRGVIFCGGYWDYPVGNRGVLFAPVLFHNRIYAQPGFRYTPSAAILASRLLLHLFVGPRWNHYYYGNYYGDIGRNFGLSPWIGYRSPLLNYYSWHFGRQNVPYLSRMQSWYQYQDRNPGVRPPITYRQQLELASRATGTSELAVLTRPWNDMVRARGFVSLNQQQRAQLGDLSNSLRGLARQRVDFESGRSGRGVGVGADATARGRFSLPQVSRAFRPIIGEDGRPEGRTPSSGIPGFRGPDDRGPGSDGRPAVRTPDIRRPETPAPGVGRPSTPGPEIRRPDTGPSPGRPSTPRPEIRRPDVGPSPGRPSTPGPEIRRPDTGPSPGRPSAPRPEIRRPDAGPSPGRPSTPGPGIRRPDAGPSPGRPSATPRATPRPSTPAPRATAPSPGRSTPSVTPRPSAPRINAPSPGRSTPSVTPRPSAPRINAPSPGRSTPSVSPRPSAPRIKAPSPGRSTPSVSPRPSAPRINAPSPSRGGPSVSPGRSGGGPSRGGGGRGPR